MFFYAYKSIAYANKVVGHAVFTKSKKASETLV